MKSLKFFCGSEQLQNSWSRGCEHFLNPLENVGKIGPPLKTSEKIEFHLNFIHFAPTR